MSSCTATEASGSAATGSSFFDSFSSAFSTFFVTAKADEGDDDEEEGKEDDDKEDDEDKEEGGDDEEEDEDDEPEDPLPAIYEDCENSKQCAPAKHHFLECQERVEAGNGFKDENCVEEFFHLAHCASECSAPRVFNQLK